MIFSKSSRTQPNAVFKTRRSKPDQFAIRPNPKAIFESQQKQPNTVFGTQPKLGNISNFADKHIVLLG